MRCLRFSRGSRINNGSFRPRLVAIDLDGTLLTSSQEVTPRAERAIRGLCAQGVKVVLCTGRPPRFTKHVAEGLDVSDLVIMHHGAIVYDFIADAMHFHTELTAETALGAIRAMREQHDGVMVGLETTYGWFMDPALFEIRQPEPPPTDVGEVEAFVQGYVTKLLFRHRDMDAEAFSRALDDFDVHCTWSSPELLEVIAKNVNKREALKQVVAVRGLSAGDVAVFGDQNNDLEMLAWAGLGVAMGNASEEAKAAANRITDTNDEDGVAKVLETWL